MTLGEALKASSQRRLGPSPVQGFNNTVDWIPAYAGMTNIWRVAQLISSRVYPLACVRTPKLSAINVWHYLSELQKMKTEQLHFWLRSGLAGLAIAVVGGISAAFGYGQLGYTLGVIGVLTGIVSMIIGAITLLNNKN